MKKNIIRALVAVALIASPAMAEGVAIGQTAQLTQGADHYTGILVKPNALAPCNAKSSADDIKFDPKHDTLVAWSKPCPKLQRWLPAAAVNAFLKAGNITLDKASSMTSQ
jgi:hypothetical protein